MKFPAVFVNHGGGPLPLLGKQPELVNHMKSIRSRYLPKDRPPRAIVVISAHWEEDPIRISSSSNPVMYYDYYGFPPETYTYKYPAPGSPKLAAKIQQFINEHFRGTNIQSVLDANRGYDHGVFIPLMIMYPEHNIPVVCVSLHNSLSASIHIELGKALSPLRKEDVLIVGSGYTFHNMNYHRPSQESRNAALSFNEWLKTTLTLATTTTTTPIPNPIRLEKLKNWKKEAPGGRLCHPRPEHLLPLLVVAGATLGDHDDEECTGQVIYDTTDDKQSHGHAVTGYLFV